MRSGVLAKRRHVRRAVEELAHRHLQIAVAWREIEQRARGGNGGVRCRVRHLKRLPQCNRISAAARPSFFFDSCPFQNQRDERCADVFAHIGIADAAQETRVKELLRDVNGKVIGVKAENAEGDHEFFAPITIDASGREAITVARSKWRIHDPKLDKIAVWTYYKGAKRDPGLEAGATTVAYLPGKGWFWYIPLADDITSVGIVGEKDYIYQDTREPAEIFAREIENNAWIKDHLSVGEQFGPHRSTGEYSYRSKYCADEGVVLTGDAFAFLDPVFSSGVFIALKSGEMAADAVHQAILDNDFSAARFEQYGKTLCSGIEVMRNLVYTFYDTNFSFRELFVKYPESRPAVTDCLIGNLFLDFDKLYSAVAEFAELPAPLTHGTPKPAEQTAAVAA